MPIFHHCNRAYTRNSSGRQKNEKRMKQNLQYRLPALLHHGLATGSHSATIDDIDRQRSAPGRHRPPPLASAVPDIHLSDADTRFRPAPFAFDGVRFVESLGFGFVFGFAGDRRTEERQTCIKLELSRGEMAEVGILYSQR